MKLFFLPGVAIPKKIKVKRYFSSSISLEALLIFRIVGKLPIQIVTQIKRNEFKLNFDQQL